ncbi:hypothetical protein ACHAWO_010698 [Cyclotella atomus]|uniref:Aminotransferase class V domain-containing protein n=1 Tax=Cyclotella atomus TaxID=382360 RepID=A0ABD3PL89_9STRA
MATKGFIVTGRAAHDRIARLFLNLVNDDQNQDAGESETKWVDLSPYAAISAGANIKVEFIWENAPRHATKSIRDSVKVYSHLPNGTNVLDDKWTLARLLGSSFVDSAQDVQWGNEAFNSALATLESHCFKGADFVIFANRVGLLCNGVESEPSQFDSSSQQYHFEDLVEVTSNAENPRTPPPAPDNLWVIKDAMSNGAGGIWILDSNNIDEFLDQNVSDDGSIQNKESVLHPTHRYVAQRYAWPPTVYYGRKCHVRVYGCINAKGEAFVHKRCFLHVANDQFQYNNKKGGFEPSVHITNCCANSHDASKFSGEICADLLETESTDQTLALGAYFPSVAASLAELTKRSSSFLRGGHANNGFEYLGMDFVLSSVPGPTSEKRIPKAFLLEVNAPPSQDTATGLPHAEELHDEVISDLLKMCVLPELGMSDIDCGGWKCVYKPTDESPDSSCAKQTVVPSKAAFINRIRWNMYEKKAAREYEMYMSTTAQKSKCESITDGFDHDAFVRLVRSQFPYFSSSRDIFFESGGGAQVSKVVMDSMLSSISCRDRSLVGSICLKEARRALLSILTGRDDDKSRHMLFMGNNATSLLDSLAHRCFSNGLQEGDELILASENHCANVMPWLHLADMVGAQVKWWTVTDKKGSTSNSTPIIESSVLSDLITPKTKIVAISHSSNVIGCVRDIPSICRLVHERTESQAQVVVDGVAASPHMLSSGVFEGDQSMQPDWYVVSLHKMFGPHLGCLIGKNTSLQRLVGQKSTHKLLEMGTMNYEACAGATALSTYFKHVGKEVMKQAGKECAGSDHSMIKSAKTAIISAEAILVDHLLCTLSQSSPMIRIIQDQGHQRIGHYADKINSKKGLARLPFVSFTHANIDSNKIVNHCRSQGVICRACRFLSTDRFWNEMGICDEDVVRFSLAHYNNIDEIDRAVDVLKKMDNWA